MLAHSDSTDLYTKSSYRITNRVWEEREGGREREREREKERERVRGQKENEF